MNQPPNTIWTTKLNQPTSLPPILVENHLLFATKPSSPTNPHSDLIALNLENGQTAWRHQFEYALVSGLQAYTLLVEGQTIGIVATQSSDLLHGQGEVLAFDETGSIVWRWQGEEKSYAAPVAQEMQLFVLAGTNTLAIVNPEGTGNDSVTRINLPINSSTSAPAIRDNIIYIPCRSPDLFAIDLSTSKQWHFHAPEHERNWLDQTPVLANDILFTVGRRGMVYALDSETLQLRWQQEIGEKRPLSQVSVNEDHVFVGFRYGLCVLDSRSGQEIWQFATTRPISAQPLVLGDIVYVSCEDHNLYTLDKTNGTELWHLEMGRRIDISPILTPSCLLVVDRGGEVVALEPPDLPEEVWSEASPRTQMRQELVAKRLMEQAEFAKAAEFWMKLGQLETAAEAYELAKEWQQAADLWRQLDRDGKRADALERYAESLTDQDIDDDTKATAWERAARAHAELRQQEARQRCEREAARYRNLPILSIEIDVKDLVINEWSKLDFLIDNIGFGPARQVIIYLVDDRFVGRAQHSSTWMTIMPDKQYNHWLEIQPLAQGEAVPMQLMVEYVVGHTGNKKTLERTFYLPVAGEEDSTGTGDAKSTGSREFARLELPDGRNPETFRKNLIDHFSVDELNDLLFDFGLRVDDFDDRVSVKAREIITWAVQNNQLEKLIAYCKEKRDFIDW